ncbi:hypothetical protein TNCV_4320521 [Trichonephila clavipes]|nr:hypothetical protein TNCV_4320521 [Trichonephila clavipes]
MARNHLDDFTRGRMIRKLEEGRTVTSVAAEFGINKSVVSPAWKAFQTTGTDSCSKGWWWPPEDDNCRGCPIYHPAGKKRPTAVRKHHCSATLYINGATSVTVYCGQTPSRRGPICPPS